MAQKTVRYNEQGVAKLPDNRPVVYRILTAGGNQNYVGIAQQGRVKERIPEQVGEIPGVKVRIEQFPSIAEAEEANTISRTKPPFNELGR
ncbi:hypothetical protein FJY70_03990 [candidate division WOR-3 bacterium]|nr:hypothetical protein [candidate division WOR-3 bacterium]